MTTRNSVLEQSYLEQEYRPAVKVTVVGRSAPHFADHGIHCVEESAPAASDASYTMLIPSAPLQCRFIRQRLLAGLRSLIGAILGISYGVFLAADVATAPLLHFHLAPAAAVCICLGLGLVPSAWRDLQGCLLVDSFGVRMTPGIFGFSIPWDELDKWTIENRAFCFHAMKTGVTHRVPADHLTPHHRLSLIHTLKGCAGEVAFGKNIT